MLLPRVFKTIGLLLLVPGLVLNYLVEAEHYIIPFLNYNVATVSPFEFINRINNFTDEVAGTVLIAALMFIGFSRNAKENSITRKVRLVALYWAVIAVSGVTALYLVVSYFFTLTPSLALLNPFKKLVTLSYYLIPFNFHIILSVFICRFYYLLNKWKVASQIKGIYQLPYQPYRIIAKVATGLYILLIIYTSMFRMPQGPTDEIFMLLPACIFFWLWSQEKGSTENAVLKAIYLSVYINGLLFIIASWSIYGTDYIDVICYGLISTQIVYLIIFYYRRFTVARRAGKNRFVQTAVR